MFVLKLSGEQNNLHNSNVIMYPIGTNPNILDYVFLTLIMF